MTEAAIAEYLTSRSKKLKDADKAPYKDRHMLRNGSKRQTSLLAWATEQGFLRLDQITHRGLDAWRNTWTFRENSYSMRVHNGVVKAFFKWAINFHYLVKNPYVKLDLIEVEEVPTLPLEDDEYPRMLAAVTVMPLTNQQKLTTHMLLMRWDGLAITDGRLQLRVP